MSKKDSGEDKLAPAEPVAAAPVKATTANPAKRDGVAEAKLQIARLVKGELEEIGDNVTIVLRKGSKPSLQIGDIHLPPHSAENPEIELSAVDAAGVLRYYGDTYALLRHARKKEVDTAAPAFPESETESDAAKEAVDALLKEGK